MNEDQRQNLLCTRKAPFEHLSEVWEFLISSVIYPILLVNRIISKLIIK